MTAQNRNEFVTRKRPAKKPTASATEIAASHIETFLFIHESPTRYLILMSPGRTPALPEPLNHNRPHQQRQWGRLQEFSAQNQLSDIA